MISSIEPPTPTRPTSSTLSAELNVRSAKRRTSSSGLSSLPCLRTNTTAKTTPMRAAAIIGRSGPSLAKRFTA